MTLSLYDLTVAQLAPLAEAAINEWRSIEGQITLATPTSPDTDSPAILRALQLARLQALRTAEDMLGRLRRKHEETEEATRAKIAETMPSRSPCGVHGCTRPPNHAGPHNTAQPDAPPDPPAVCGAVLSDGQHSCQRPTDHDGPHEDRTGPAW